MGGRSPSHGPGPVGGCRLGGRSEECGDSVGEEREAGKVWFHVKRIRRVSYPLVLRTSITRF